MIEIKNILLPTDFSESAAEATKYACALADQFGATLHLLHVLPDLSTWMPDYLDIVKESVVSYREQSEVEAITRMAGLLDPNWEAENEALRITKEGKPHVEIIVYAKSQEIDLIVMSTHGRTGLSHVLIGSVAERVVQMAPCPVLTVRPPGHQFVMP